jgi:hypothetical protein
MSSPATERPQTLALPVIPATSPSLAEAMRTCLLRAGFSKTPGISAYVLGNPKAWLGTAYHRVLEHLPHLARADAPTRLQELWGQEIAHLEQQTAGHPLNRRFGAASSWRGYYLVLETLKLRVADLAPSAGNRAIPETEEDETRTFREEDLLAFGGKLKGKPDVARGDEILDFKTGSIYEAAEDEALPALKQAYVRQLQIYAFLVHEKTGRWPRRGLLYPIAGPPVDIDLDPAVCAEEAAKAVALLERYNEAVRRMATPEALASPSQEACRWCPYKLLCPAFWKAADESWAGTLDGEAVAGPLVEAPRAVHGGAACSISLTADAGTVPQGDIALSSLPVAVHGATAGLAAGDRVGSVGLGRRQNGSLFPTLRTVFLPEAEIPTVEMVPGDVP